MTLFDRLPEAEPTPPSPSVKKRKSRPLFQDGVTAGTDAINALRTVTPDDQQRKMAYEFVQNFIMHNRPEPSIATLAEELLEAARRLSYRMADDPAAAEELQVPGTSAFVLNDDDGSRRMSGAEAVQEALDLLNKLVVPNSTPSPADVLPEPHDDAELPDAAPPSKARPRGTKAMPFLLPGQNAVLLANRAIEALMAILHTDPKRQRGMDMVDSWIQSNR